VLNLSHPGRVDFEIDFDISPQSSLSFSIRWGKQKPQIFILGANIVAVAALLGLAITWPA
jgi:hypothetical protein